MLEDLPLEILIIIINHLTTLDVISLLQLKNYRISMACINLEKINLFFCSKKFYRYLPLFKNPSELSIADLRMRKNSVVYTILLKNWKLKKLAFYNSKFLKFDVLKKLFKDQNKLETLNLNSCCQLNHVHLKLLTKNIKHLYLANSNLEVKDLIKLNKFTKLETLDLSHSFKNLDSSFKNLVLPKLKELILISCSLNGDENIIKFFNNIDSLKKLDISASVLNNNLINVLNKKHTELEILVLNNVFITERLFRIDNIWTRLKKLDLANSYNFTDDIFFSICKSIPNIESLNLNNTKITDLSAVYISVFYKKLTHLYLAKNHIRHHTFNNLSRTYSLKFLDLSYSNITTKYINEILNKNFLEYIVLTACRNIKFENLRNKKCQLII